jgi:hypothetical protein
MQPGRSFYRDDDTTGIAIVRFSHYARIIRAITGITKINEVIIHRIVSGSFLILPLIAMIAAPKDVRPLIRAITNAINPRLRHPNTSTGVAAMTRKSTGIIEGISM